MLATLVAAALLGFEPDSTMYPGAKLLSSASGGGGGGVPRRGIAAKHQFAMTPDAFAKVVEFYDKKFDAVDFGGTRAKAGDGKAESLTAVPQAVRGGRPVEIKVYVEYKPDSSTTVVVSRSPGEKKTYVQTVTNSHTFGVMTLGSGKALEKGAGLRPPPRPWR